MENKKYYTNSAGETIDISTLHTTHLLNAYRKKAESIFESTNKEEYFKNVQELNDLKEEYHKRLNDFADKITKAEEVADGK